MLDVNFFNYTSGSSQKNKKLEDFRSKLPSYKMREEILKLIKANNVIVLSGETGCGKTTQIPQYILEDYLASGRRRAKIVCTQPRRISAIRFLNHRLRKIVQHWDISNLKID